VGNNNKGHDIAESSDTDTLTVGVSGTKEYQRQYSFKDEHMVTLFHLPDKGNKLKLSEAKRSDEVRERMILTIVFFIGWFIILLAIAMFLRTKFKC